MLALLILFLAIVLAARFLFERTDVIGIIVGQLGSSAMSAVGLAMGVALFGLIVGVPKDAAATIE